MTRSERKRQLLRMNEAEKLYKHYFELNPDIYFYDKKGDLYRNWQEFKELYLQTCNGEITLPDKEPTYMGDELDENTFFNDVESDVSLLMNARYCPPFWHHLKFIKIMYVLNGEFELNISHEKTIKLTCGNFVIVPPNIEQSVFSYHDDDIVVNIFIRASTFEKAFSSLLMESNELSVFFWKVLYGRDDQSIIWFKCESDRYLDNLIFDIFEIIEKSEDGRNFILISSVMMFLSYALYWKRQYITTISDMSSNRDKLPDIIQYIYEHYNDISLASISRQFNISEGYMSRYIRRETGYTLSNLLREYRMSRAAIMLRETSCSVEEIMFKVGYTDISYFYRVFKKKYGMTPNQYRRQAKIIKLV